MISGTVLCLLYPSANWGMIVGGFGALRFLKNLIKVELNERPDRIYRKLPVSTHGFLLRCQTEARAFRTLLRSPPVRVRKRQFGDGEEEEEGGAHTSTHWEERETNEGRSAASDSSSSTSSSAGGTNTRIYETHELASQVLRIADTHARVADFMSSPLKCITSNSTGHQMTSGGITVTMVSVYLEGKGEEAAKVQAIALNRDIVLLVFLPMHVVNPLWLFPEGASLDISPAEPDCAHYMRQAAFRLENLFLAADGEFREAFREAARGFDAIRMMDLFGLGRVFGL
uniref:Uncharacterized protein n=1 Tax=Chromera velia CCMP2878 TaxID=1169474 RepID=A0A0G4G8V2_9ALVE|eukprot:Cvel_20757.t1-p1 / transcript=Cvel_20757.t1 / gene=Cvel_20757 / organism=Chromera_velia_CCMP2878 / gene_product=hypothetical protein / transcript_product=hypothetical protein / location=Cvel_scaffold1892:8042-10748(+) / protein_length=284 / sequence_SO=supercontig / SO=protein_coding / is_pseudo=false